LPVAALSPAAPSATTSTHHVKVKHLGVYTAPGSHQVCNMYTIDG
jgi:hypothetical protein